MICLSHTATFPPMARLPLPLDSLPLPEAVSDATRLELQNATAFLEQLSNSVQESEDIRRWSFLAFKNNNFPFARHVSVLQFCRLQAFLTFQLPSRPRLPLLFRSPNNDEASVPGENVFVIYSKSRRFRASEIIPSAQRKLLWCEACHCYNNHRFPFCHNIICGRCGQKGHSTPYCLTLPEE